MLPSKAHIYRRTTLPKLRAWVEAQTVRLYSVVQANIRAEIAQEIDEIRAEIRERVAGLTPELAELTAMRDQLTAMKNRPHTDDVTHALWASLVQLEIARQKLAEQADKEAQAQAEVAA